MRSSEEVLSGESESKRITAGTYASTQSVVHCLKRIRPRGVGGSSWRRVKDKKEPRGKSTAREGGFKNGLGRPKENINIHIPSLSKGKERRTARRKGKGAPGPRYRAMGNIGGVASNFASKKTTSTEGLGRAASRVGTEFRGEGWNKVELSSQKGQGKRGATSKKRKANLQPSALLSEACTDQRCPRKASDGAGAKR